MLLWMFLYEKMQFIFVFIISWVFNIYFICLFWQILYEYLLYWILSICFICRCWQILLSCTRLSFVWARLSKIDIQCSEHLLGIPGKVRFTKRYKIYKLNELTFRWVKVNLNFMSSKPDFPWFIGDDVTRLKSSTSEQKIDIQIKRSKVTTTTSIE